MKYLLSKTWSSTWVSAVLIASLFSSTTVFAQFEGHSVEPIENIGASVSAVGGVVNTTTIVIVALAFLFFFWYLAVFILKSGDDEAQKKAKARMIYSIVAIVVITSLWGIIAFVRSIVGIGAGEDEAINAIPRVEVRDSNF